MLEDQSAASLGQSERLPVQGGSATSLSVADRVGPPTSPRSRVVRPPANLLLVPRVTFPSLVEDWVAAVFMPDEGAAERPAGVRWVGEVFA